MTRIALLLALVLRLAGGPLAAAESAAPPEEVVAGASEAWDALAKKHWGDAALGAELARANGASRDAPIAEGTAIRIPPLLRHTVAPGDTLVGIARRFLGSAEAVDEIRRFNPKLKSDLLLVGQKIRVPQLQPGRAPAAAVEAPKPPPVAEKKPEAPGREVARAAPPAPARAPAPPPEPAVAEVSAPPPEPLPQVDRFADDLRGAVNDYLEGRYEESLEKLESLREPVLAEGSEAERESLLRHLFYVYVAFDRTERACETYKTLEAVAPDARWDPDMVSPKILRAVEDCQGG
jgi:LysM repeat protein